MSFVVINTQGGEVVRYVGDIPRDDDSPIILAYIDLNLQTLHDTGIISGNLPPAFSHNDHVISQYFGSIDAALSPRQQHDPPLSPDRSAASSMSGDGIGPDTMKAELAAIFKKIGDKSMSKEGMVDLYHFQQEHAAVSDPSGWKHLASSPFITVLLAITVSTCMCFEVCV